MSGELRLRVLLLVVGLAVALLTVLLARSETPEVPDPVVEAAPTTTTTVPPPPETTTTVPPPTTTTLPEPPKPPPPPPPPPPAAASAASGSIPAMVRDAFSRFGAHVANQAVAIVRCETGGTFDPNSTGRQGEVGLAQLHPRWQSGRAAKFGWSMNDLYDPAKNLVVAVDLYSESGWSQWSCRRVL